MCLQSKFIKDEIYNFIWFLSPPYFVSNSSHDLNYYLPN